MAETGPLPAVVTVPTVVAPAGPRPRTSLKRRVLRSAVRALPVPTAQVARGLVGSVESVHTAEPLVALTFDDGPDPTCTPSILDALDEQGARATFFVLGRQAERWPELVREVRARGHEVGLHGDDHTRLRGATVREVHACIVGGRRRLEQVLGERVTTFRPPYGSLSPYAYAVARSRGMQVILWSANARDAHDAPLGSLVANAVSGLRPGAIVLLHDRSDHAAAPRQAPPLDRAALVGSVLRAVADRGWRATTVGDLLATGAPAHVVRFPH